MITLPHANYCPLCGTELEEKDADGRKRFYCGKCDQIVWKNPKLASGTLVTRDNEVLLIKRGAEPNKGSWSIPAGFVEWEEASKEAASRELEEETSLKVETVNMTFEGNLHVKHPDGKFLVVNVHGIDFSDTTGEISAGDDAEKARFWTLSEIKKSEEELESSELKEFLIEHL